MIFKLICTKDQVTPSFIYGDIKHIKEGIIYTATTSTTYLDWEDFCKVNREVWITDVRAWFPTSHFNDIITNREDDNLEGYEMKYEVI